MAEYSRETMSHVQNIHSAYHQTNVKSGYVKIFATNLCWSAVTARPFCELPLGASAEQPTYPVVVLQMQFGTVHMDGSLMVTTEELTFIR